jgi:hypothetical protein
MVVCAHKCTLTHTSKKPWGNEKLLKFSRREGDSVIYQMKNHDDVEPLDNKNSEGKFFYT